MAHFPSELRRWRTARRMSQLDLARRAGTSQRHVSFVEQGRSRPGRSVVLRLAESMELTRRERNELLLAAGFAPGLLAPPVNVFRPALHPEGLPPGCATCLITTLTSFATAADVTLAELHLEAFLPADDRTAEVIRRRWG